MIKKIKKKLKKKIFGTLEKPRVCIFRSNNHCYLQAIDDKNQHTIVSLSTLKTKVNKDYLSLNICENLGKNFGHLLVAKNITKILFDKNGNRYHGRIAAVANKIRQHNIFF